MNRSRTRLLCALGLVGLGLGTPLARAESSAAGEEFLDLTEAAPPNVLFVLDMATDMNDPCHATSGAFTDPCFEDAIDAIEMVAQHFDFARFGVVGTAATDSDDTFFPIVPLGSNYTEIHAALEALRVSGPHGEDTRSGVTGPVRNHAEVLGELATNYFGSNDYDDPAVDSDGDGYGYDFTKAPIEYSCQQNHIVVLTRQRPEGDDDVRSTWTGSLSADVFCDSGGRTTSTSASDEQCYYDNVVGELYSSDMRADLTGTQNVVVHTVGLGISSSSVAEELYGSASVAADPTGMYAVAGDPNQILTYILYVLRDLRAGTYSRSTPVLSADGNYLVYSFYELGGDDTVLAGSGFSLGRGHIRAYPIGQDPADTSTYGQVIYDHTNCGDDLSYSCGGALWDGGDLLVSRLVTSDDYQTDDNDGDGLRDIYTFWEPAASSTHNSFGSDATSDQRMPLDRRFADAVGADPALLGQILDLSVDSVTGCSTTAAEAFDFDKGGGCTAVDQDDLREMLAFVRGYTLSEFRYLPDNRGRWRLGDAPHAVPVVVQARNNAFAIEPSYRRFLELLEANEADGSSPAIVLQPANDGMLHAFALSNNATTSHTDQGEELWAWVPGYLLEKDHDAEWAGRLVDMILFGRTFLFDGSPVVEDVWLDEDGDGVKECDSVPDNCEWRRVVVVQQGKGGPVTLALDITDTDAPKFLWEQTDETDATAMGFTTGKPVIANVYDTSNPTAGDIDRWVAFWGSGRGVATSGDYENAEPNLYVWAVGDSYWESSKVGFQAPSTSADWARGDNGHPEEDSEGGALNNDSDGHYEFGYISASLAVVDVDSDGDVDTLYFPVTTAYTPSSESGSGPGDTASPGSTWMMKACVDTSDPGDLTWVEYFDPKDDASLSHRPEVYYSATTAWHTDGSLGVYWGTGTPYNRTGSDPGYFFATKDSNPASCAGDSMELITDCGSGGGVVPLSGGEGLTSDPIVYAGVVYFSTWVPATDRCDGGDGRLYGISYTDCTTALDVNGDGTVTGADGDYKQEEDAYISGLTVTDKGTLFYGTSNAATDGSGSPVGTITSTTDPFLGTQTLAWMEVF